MKTAPSKQPAKSVGARLVDALRELETALADGKRPAKVFTSRTYSIPDPPAFDRQAVRALRERLGVSQAVFASILGASLPLVQGWEQGKRVPNPMARRLLGEIADNPNRWRRMVTAGKR